MAYKLRKPKQMRNGALWEKKEKACTDEEKEDHGDHWDHAVMDAESKAVISIVFCALAIASQGMASEPKRDSSFGPRSVSEIA